MIGETGVGLSNELKTIDASDEWWRARIQVSICYSLRFYNVIMFCEDNDKSINFVM